MAWGIAVLVTCAQMLSLFKLCEVWLHRSSLLLVQKAFGIGIVAVASGRDLSCMSFEALHSRDLVHVQRIVAGLLDQHSVAVQPVSLTHFMAQPDILPIDILSESYLPSTKVGRRSLVKAISVLV